MKDEKQESQVFPNKLQIRIVANGPALIQGPVVIIDQLGNKEDKESMFALCRCGGSHKKPYCDGTHNFNDFKD